MPTNKQRREAARRHLERQLERRQQREATRKRVTLYSSIAGTIIAVAAIVVAVVVLSGGSSKNKADNPTVSSPTTTRTPSSSASKAPAAKAATGPSVTFAGVTVKGAADLSGYPVLTAKESTPPKTIEVKDLVVGKGAAATSTSSVTVQYVGVLYKNGTQFDSSWTNGTPAQFSLNGGVIRGFQEGIGGTKGVTPMHVGGRRLMILPSALAYASTAQGTIPANSDLVFVVDLKAVA